MRLEYVASGCRGVKLLSKFILEEEETLDICRKHVVDMNSLVEGHNFSTLFNGLTEGSLGKAMKDYYGDILYKIHADSGGLQEVTLGKKIVDKRDIFKVQSAYSDIAMSFDEIPVELPDGKATIQGSGSRLYSKELLVPKAKKTGENLKNQLRYFAENQSNSRVFLILQGNCFDSYQTWLDVIWEEIKDEDLSYIGGIASAAAALGSGSLEDFKRAFIVSNMSYPKELMNLSIHVLGVGSIVRLLPFLVSDKLASKHISYDSTSFTKSMFMGSYYHNQTLKSYDQGDKISSAKIYMNDNIDTLEKYGLYIPSEEEFIQYQITPGGDRLEFMDTLEKKISFTNTRMSTFSNMVFKFYEDCDQIKSGDLYQFPLFRGRRKNMVNCIENFRKLRDKKDFDEWLGMNAQILPSNPYPVKEQIMTYDIF